MRDDNKASPRSALANLERAIAAWLDRGETERLERWLGRELDDEGVSPRLTLSEWWTGLRALMGAREARRGWPRRLDSPLLKLARSLLRFTRPDGVPPPWALGSISAEEARALLGQLARAFPMSREARVVAWMLGRPEPHHSPPPLPAWSSEGQALGVLRASWKKDADVLLVDQREPSQAASFELIGAGVPWLGPRWRLANAVPSASPARPVHWHSDSVADLYEWSYRDGGLARIRSALLLRGRRLAILGEQLSLGAAAAGEAADLEVGLAAGVRVTPLVGARGFDLSVEGRKAGAQILPLGLPALPYETDRGRFQADEAAGLLRLHMMTSGRRCWLPVLVSWDPARHRRRLDWRALTITEEGRMCPPDEAFAVRVSWGRDDTLVVYRSLGPPAHRAFLGYQTEARFLVGEFNSEGIVEPLVTVEA